MRAKLDGGGSHKHKRTVSKTILVFVFMFELELDVRLPLHARLVCGKSEKLLNVLGQELLVLARHQVVDEQRHLGIGRIAYA